MPEMNEEVPNLVLVRTCGDNAEAALVKSLLTSRGILAVVRGENHRSMLGALGAYIELHVLVPGKQKEEAEKVLEEFDSGALEGGVEPDDDAPAPLGLRGAQCAVHGRAANSTCARCGAFLCENCGSGEGIICTACEAKLEREEAGGGRVERRRRIALFMLFIFVGGPALLALGYQALFSLRR